MVQTSEPRRSKARAKVGEPPRKKSAAVVTIIAPNLRSARRALMARRILNAEATLISS
jgi:hypothetical protein